jgi:beta-glucuronidase
VPPALLDWADENGVLIIEQCPIWGNTVPQLASPQMRALFKTQLEEMIRRDWNHPSVIGWSVGNEYESDRPEGVSWTREMSAWVRSLDRSRLTSMASMYAFRDRFNKPEEEASHHVDLININVYGPPDEVLKRLDRVHSLWPNRVVLISEFVSMDALTLGEAERVRYAREFLDVIRKYPYVAGVSLWTFNDYRSRWPQTGKWPATSEDGYRTFGAVTADRRTLGLYDALREEFSPAVIREVRPADAKATVRVAARLDFPSYTLRDYVVRCTWMDADWRTLDSGIAKLPALRPGEEASATCRCRGASVKYAAVKVEVVRPTGFASAEQTVPLRQ